MCGGSVGMGLMRNEQLRCLDAAAFFVWWRGKGGAKSGEGGRGCGGCGGEVESE